MDRAAPASISSAVEGLVDEAIIRKLIQEAGADAGPVYGKTGKGRLRRQIAGYNQAARFHPWVVLVDLDQDADCAPILREAWLPSPARHTCFRIFVRAAEAWLIADTEGLARFLGISRSRIPADPERLPSPKDVMISLARHSSRREIEEDMVPRPRSGRVAGPAYSSRMIEFVSRDWRPDAAQRNSDSLRRCRSRIHEMVHLIVQ